MGAAGVDHGVTRREAFKVWALVAANSFGGPAGQIAVMHRFLVEERRWISEQRFLHALNYCMLLPGPEAQQLAVYIGWLMHGTLGGVMAGVLFVLPGVLAIFALSVSYALFNGIDAVAGLLFGLQAAVVAVVIEAVLRIGRRALVSRAHVAIAGLAFLAIFFAEVAFPIIVLTAGVFGFVMTKLRPATFARAEHSPAADDGDAAHIADDGAAISPAARRSAFRAAAVALTVWLIPVAILTATLGMNHVFAQEAVLFSKSAVVTFGGAYAALAYISQAAVTGYGWLRPGEMLTGLGMAETTPGPLIMVVQFVGFMAAYRNPGGLSPLAAATLGSALTTWVTFAPCFFFIFAGAPFIERLRGNAALSGALGAVTAAVVGVIGNLAVWFSLHTAFAEIRSYRWAGLRLLVPQPASIDVLAVALMALAVVAMFRLKIGVMRTLALCGAIGVIVRVAEDLLS